MMRAPNTGNLLRKKRKKAKLTQRQISDFLKYKTPQFVSNIERGLCGIPIEDIPEYANILGISSSTIITAMTKDYKERLERISQQDT